MSKKKTQKKTTKAADEFVAVVTTDTNEATATEVAAEAANEPTGGAVATDEPVAAVAVAEEPAKKKGKRAKGELTLTELAERYLRHLEDQGKSTGTCLGYRFEMQSALDELGPESPIGEITVKEVEKYFACPRVTRTRTGKQKSPLSIAKTQRVLRQALAYAAAKGWIDVLPLYAGAAAAAR